jgi:hypothetical protein
MTPCTVTIHYVAQSKALGARFYKLAATKKQSGDNKKQSSIKFKQPNFSHNLAYKFMQCHMNSSLLKWTILFT